MRILWVVTKPPWPPTDGGRVVIANTLRALAAEGHELTLVSPFDPAHHDRGELERNLREVCEPRLVAASPMGLARAFLRSQWDGLPVSVSRHALPAVAREVVRCLAAERFDVVHAEQLHALPQCEPAARPAVPVVLRSQNVESDLWSGRARAGGVLGRLAQHESRRLARYEARAVQTVAATVALTVRDADRLRRLSAGSGAVHRVPAPFPERLPPAPHPASGAPAVVVLAGDWWPNREGAATFVSRMWPAVHEQTPTALLHLFGTIAPSSLPGGVVVHPLPADRSAAFPPGAILVVPVWVASGVRVKILEAWARGVPVVATPDAAAGLDAQDGRELLIAHDRPGFAAAIRRLQKEPVFADTLVQAGRALLRRGHDPQRVARQLAEVYAGVATPNRVAGPRLA